MTLKPFHNQTLPRLLQARNRPILNQLPHLKRRPKRHKVRPRFEFESPPRHCRALAVSPRTSRLGHTARATVGLTNRETAGALPNKGRERWVAMCNTPRPFNQPTNVKKRARSGAPTSIALIYTNPLSYTIAPR